MGTKKILMIVGDYSITWRSFSFYILVAAIFLVTFVCSNATACSTILVGKALTADGSVLFGHNEDMGLEAVGRLWSEEAHTFTESAHIEVPYVRIRQAHRTHAYWASGNPRGNKGLGIGKQHPRYDSVLVGMNQWGVAMACNWAHSKEDSAPGKGIRRYAIRQLILERCKTAGEAVKLIGNLIDKHGQADWGGLIYAVTDSNEAWVVETTTHHWVARRVPDDAIRVIANRFTIGDDFDLASHDLSQFAEIRGWYDPDHGKLSFRDTYGLPEKMNQPYDIDRETRMLKLLDGKRGHIEPEDIFALLRDRYESTDMYTRPQIIPVWRENLDKDPSLSRTISSNLCQSSSVVQLRGNLPVEVGAIMWYTMANPGYSNYFPIYAGADRVPEIFSRHNAGRSPDSAWWLFKKLQIAGDSDYDKSYPLVKNFLDEQHALVTAQQQIIEKKALALIRNSNKDEAIKLLRTFTFNQARYALNHTQHLLEHVQPRRKEPAVAR